MEALAAHADTNLGKFEPALAFICNKPAMHRVVNGWEADFNKSTSCIDDPDDILDYCKKLYPDHDIRNVVEAAYKVDIGDWPRFPGIPESESNIVHRVRPFKCIADFESEALLVPQHCVFDHEHDTSRCERPSNWTQTASKMCYGRAMMLEASGMLVVCGIDKFRGVEYVCCPKEDTEPTVASYSSSESSEEDDYIAYLKGDDVFLSKYDNEHQKFKAAEKAMQKHQHEKVTLMMKEWQAARDHVSEMRKTDNNKAEQLNKDITEKFQRMYQAYEKEGVAEKKQLVALHQQHVQGMFNKKKRELMEQLASELEEDEPRTSKVLSYLKLYIRTEEKDRLHSVNHYEHLRDTDPEEAIRIRHSVQEHLKLITKRIEQAIDMLKRHPDLEKKIKPEIEEFRHKKFRNIEISSEDVVLKPIEEGAPDQKEVILTPIDSSESFESEDNHDYTNIRIDTEGLQAEDTNQQYIAHAHNDGVHIQQKSFNSVQAVSNNSTGSVVGIAIGSVAVFIIIVVAVVMLRKRSRRQPITHGFVEVDPAASPEERHVANMQMNGYENPTYRYFEIQ